MVVVGGQAPKAIRSVECYDFEEQRWYQVAELPTRRCRAGKTPNDTTWYNTHRLFWSNDLQTYIIELKQ